MDIRWKDGAGNILNANKERILYYETETDTKIKLTNEEIKKITIEDGLMNIFRDFENDLVLTIVIPKGHNRKAKKIFNEYDKTGRLLKRNSGNFFIDLILDSSVITYNPFTGILIILFLIVALFAIIVNLPIFLLGEKLGLLVSRILIISSIIYPVLSHILLRIKRKRLKEINTRKAL